MTEKVLTEKIKLFFPRAKFDVAIAPHTTFGVGGRALAALALTAPPRLVAALKLARANQIPYTIIAGGSNVVWPDKTYQGLAIIFRDPRAEVVCQGLTLTVNASAPLAKLISGAVKNGLAGLESLSGIFGTVGGAIVGNAGAYGQSISDRLVAVEVWNPRSDLKDAPRSDLGSIWLTKKQCRFAYRDSIFKHEDLIVLRAKFKLEKGDKKELAKKSREIIKIRNKKYPPSLRCPGSFFKNVIQPDGSKIIAGKLLEEVGAKGRRVGGIFVADYHGNLLINDGRGTCAEVKKLAAKLKQLVYNKFKIKLEEEVRFVK